MGSHSYEQCILIWFSLYPSHCLSFTCLVKGIPLGMRWHFMASISIVNSDVKHFLLVPICHLHVFKKYFAYFQTDFFLALEFFRLFTYFAVNPWSDVQGESFFSNQWVVFFLYHVSVAVQNPFEFFPFLFVLLILLPVF